MKQRNKWFWVFFVIFVIAVGVGAGYYFGQKDREQVYEDLYVWMEKLRVKEA